MTAPSGKRRYTVEQYLELEAASEEKHEYIDGIMRDMDGAVWEPDYPPPPPKYLPRRPIGLPAEKRRYTIEEYLEMELTAIEKHEYHDGEVLAMSGGTYESSIINANLVRRLGNLLDGKPCRVTDSHLRVRPVNERRYVYPDMMIVCGAPAFDSLDSLRMTINNPHVVIEVLSPSTEAYDRGDKFTFYRRLESMEEYVLVSQDKANVESFLKLSDGTWSLAVSSGLEAMAKIRCLGIELPLAEVYAGVDWPVSPEQLSRT